MILLGKVKVLQILLAAVLLSASEVSAQEDEPVDLAPPPVKLLVEDDKKQIDQEKDIRKQVEISVLLLEEKLKEAELAIQQENYRASLDQLGKYQALVEYMVNTFGKHKPQNDRFFKATKNFEIALRKQTPRLELIRRGMPLRYGWHVQKLIRFVREARSKTIEPMLVDATG